MKDFISLLTLVVTVTVAAAAVNKTSSSSSLLVNAPKINGSIRRLGLTEGLEDGSDVSEVDMKLLRIITDMTYPDSASNEIERNNARYKLISENSGGVETYSIGEDNDRSRISSLVDGGEDFSSSIEDDFPVKTVRIVSETEANHKDEIKIPVKTVKVLNEKNKYSLPQGLKQTIRVIDNNEPRRKTFRPITNYDGSSIAYQPAASSNSFKEIHTGVSDGYKLDAEATDNGGYSYSRPEKTKTVKIEGGFTLKVADDGGRGNNFLESSSGDKGHGHHHGPKRGRGRGRRPPPRGRPFHGGHNRPPPPPPNRNRRPPGRTIRIIHENNSAGRGGGGGRHINPDIQAFQIISSGHHHNHHSDDGPTVYRIRAVE